MPVSVELTDEQADIIVTDKIYDAYCAHLDVLIDDGNELLDQIQESLEQDLDLDAMIANVEGYLDFVATGYELLDKFSTVFELFNDGVLELPTLDELNEVVDEISVKFQEQLEMKEFIDDVVSELLTQLTQSFDVEEVATRSYSDCGCDVCQCSNQQDKEDNDEGVHYFTWI